MSQVFRYVVNPSHRKILRRGFYPGFPADRPAVYELYWAPSQILARAHPNILRTQAFLMSHWHCAEKSALISTAYPTTYADRLRLRSPATSASLWAPMLMAAAARGGKKAGTAPLTYTKIYSAVNGIITILGKAAVVSPS